MIDGLKRLARGESNIDIVGRTRTWAIVSGAVILVSLIGLVGFRLNFGIEFEGGTAISTRIVDDDVNVEEVEQALESFELGEVKVQFTTRGKTPSDPADAPSEIRDVLIRTAPIGDAAKLVEIQSAIAEAVGQVTPGGEPNIDAVSFTDVGPSWGRQISNKALRGLIVFLVLVALYISLRFEPKMAAAALGAVFHDLLATAGIYAIVGFEVTPATVIALLTLLGFSLYDTVVVFDKIKENAEATTRGTMPYGQIVNRSVNQVMMRSINTSIAAVVPVGGLLFVGVFLFGAVTLKDLALAMFIGTLVSTYSSIFVAAPILAVLKEREPRYRGIRSPTVARRPTPAAPQTTTTLLEERGETMEATAPSPARPPLSAPSAPRAYRPRGRKRGKRR